MNKSKLVIVFTLLSIVFAGCSAEEQQMELSTEASTEVGTNVIDEGKIYVYVSGQVKNPGVYQVSSDARVFQVIDMAGGMTKKAKRDSLNLAETVFDGQNICVMSKRQYKKNTQTDTDADMATIQSDMININMADAVLLCTLPGIGDAKANAIVAYREENGNFASIEDIKSVSGIGEATFSNIKDLITV